MRNRPNVVALIAKTATLNFITGALPLDSRNILTLTLQSSTEAYLEVDFITIKIGSAAGKEAAGHVNLAILDTRKNTLWYMETHLGLKEQFTNSDGSGEFSETKCHEEEGGPYQNGICQFFEALGRHNTKSPWSMESAFPDLGFQTGHFGGIQQSDEDILCQTWT